MNQLGRFRFRCYLLGTGGDFVFADVESNPVICFQFGLEL